MVLYKAIINIASNRAEDCIYIDDKEELLGPAKEL
jgi:hypothetical protein